MIQILRVNTCDLNVLLHIGRRGRAELSAARSLLAFAWLIFNYSNLARKHVRLESFDYSNLAKLSAQVLRIASLYVRLEIKHVRLESLRGRIRYS